MILHHGILTEILEVFAMITSFNTPIFYRAVLWKGAGFIPYPNDIKAKEKNLINK